VPVQDLQTGLAAVQGGQVGAFAITAPTAQYAVERARSVGLAWHPYMLPEDERPLVEGCSALAFRLEDEDLAAIADRALREFLTSARHRTVLAALGLSEDVWFEPAPPVEN
jgi:hypothetical protein